MRYELIGTLLLSSCTSWSLLGPPPEDHGFCEVCDSLANAIGNTCHNKEPFAQMDSVSGRAVAQVEVWLIEEYYGQRDVVLESNETCLTSEALDEISDRTLDCVAFAQCLKDVGVELPNEWPVLDEHPMVEGNFINIEECDGVDVVE